MKESKLLIETEARLPVSVAATSARRMGGKEIAEVRRRGSSRSHKSPLSVALARRNARFYARLELNGKKSYDDDASNASRGRAADERGR